MTPREIWRAVPSNDRYEVSSTGLVRPAGRTFGNQPHAPLKPWRGAQGEPTVTLIARGRPAAARVSDLVAEAFGQIAEASR